MSVQQEPQHKLWVWFCFSSPLPNSPGLSHSLVPVTGEWAGEAKEIPGSLKLPLQELSNHRVLEAVVFCPVNTEVLVLLDQGQDGPEPLGQAEVVLPAALLPGKDSEQLQGIARGQRGPCGPRGLLCLHL